MKDAVINRNWIIRFFPVEKEGVTFHGRPDTLLTGRTLKLTVGEAMAEKMIDKVMKKGLDRVEIKLRATGRFVFVGK